MLNAAMITINSFFILFFYLIMVLRQTVQLFHYANIIIFLSPLQAYLYVFIIKFFEIRIILINSLCCIINNGKPLGIAHLSSKGINNFKYLIETFYTFIQ